eukprot:TRINITY_DN9954_c0_g1_i1.p1 TRINITY_DN9954_c0_g1~~TRINITY_DN9954_c0_g1_i1.p1  ORF type:complete len:276 (+),score=58.14 TRINITY_DN9954_c0_g1_i1:34-861(+)
MALSCASAAAVGWLYTTTKLSFNLIARYRIQNTLRDLTDTETGITLRLGREALLKISQQRDGHDLVLNGISAANMLLQVSGLSSRLLIDPSPASIGDVADEEKPVGTYLLRSSFGYSNITPAPQWDQRLLSDDYRKYTADAETVCHALSELGLTLPLSAASHEVLTVRFVPFAEGKPIFILGQTKDDKFQYRFAANSAEECLVYGYPVMRYGIASAVTLFIAASTLLYVQEEMVRKDNGELPRFASVTQAMNAVHSWAMPDRPKKHNDTAKELHD